MTEIKTSYRKLAMQLHPDRHKGCPKKMKEFKSVNEAYTVLMDTRQRSTYDFQYGHVFNKNRQTAPPKNYRKVYAPRPPPSWKRTWDHSHHKSMHYGDGFQKNAMKHAIEQAKKNGEFTYKSPLGKGFSFGKDHAENINPYSKLSPQGPPKVEFEYEESTVNMKSGTRSSNKRERVVHDMHSRRYERQAHQTAMEKRQQQRYKSAFAADDHDECIIL